MAAAAPTATTSTPSTVDHSGRSGHRQHRQRRSVDAEPGVGAHPNFHRWKSLQTVPLPAGKAPTKTMIRQNSRYKDCLALYVADVDMAPKTLQPIDTAPDGMPTQSPDTLRVVCISDTHLRHRRVRVPRADVLVHAGDIMMKSRKYTDEENAEAFADFNEWLGELPVRHKLIVGGNHDAYVESLGKVGAQKALSHAHYVQDDLVEIEGVTFYGTPFSHGRSGNRAFQKPHGAPDDAGSLCSVPPCDVFIAHGTRSEAVKAAMATTGCCVAITGHDHDLFGASLSHEGRLQIVASSVDAGYHATNVPIVFDIPCHSKPNPKASAVPPTKHTRAAVRTSS